MLEHVSIPVRDHKKSKVLYAAILTPLGYKPKYEMEDSTGFMEGGHTSIWITQKSEMTPIHVAILGKSKKAVDDFHATALSEGATDNGGPGFRTDYGDDYYAAFIHDFDGNNIEACYFGAKASKGA
jgi:predicted lactoylglutathione lyase